MIRCVLVDDEPLARDRLRRLLEESRFPVEIVGESDGGDEAVTMIAELRPDVVFLDVQMPQLDGFEIVELLPTPRPRIVFITAYDRYAVRAFDVDALDYLTKPVRAERLGATLARVVVSGDRYDTVVDEMLRDRARRALTRLTVHAGPRLRVVPVDEIRIIESCDRSVYVRLAGGISYPTDMTLDRLESRLDGRAFLRVHRSFIVNISFVREFITGFAGVGTLRLDDGATIPVARRRVRDVKRLLERE
jgi:two-component system LytT family response regulator